jgi:thiol-disulfide isomerase/thioredoxin
MKNLLIISFFGLLGSLLGLRVVILKEQPEPLPNLSIGKNIIQLNYEWNKVNTYSWKKTLGVKYYYLSVDKFPELKTKMRITSVPTIIVLEEGKEIKRFEGGMMMKINVPQTEIIK